MKSYSLKIDKKGRVLIPKTIRNDLSLKNDLILVHSESKAVIYSSKFDPEKIISFILYISDSPGSLSKIANVLYKNKINLLKTNSQSLNKGAIWVVTCDISNLKKDIEVLFMDLKSKKLINKWEFSGN